MVYHEILVKRSKAGQRNSTQQLLTVNKISKLKLYLLYVLTLPQFTLTVSVFVYIAYTSRTFIQSD